MYTRVKAHLLGTMQKMHVDCNNVFNMIKYLLVLKGAFQKIPGHTDRQTYISDKWVHIGKGIFHSKNAYKLPNTGPLSEHDHAFTNHDQIFTGFEADFSKITEQTDRHT